MRAFLLVLLVALVGGIPASAQTPDFVREKNVAVAMRDGVVLRADVWRPRGEGRFPVLVYRTPYGKDDALAEYPIFARAVERGYAIVAQDVRGRYASAGEFEPYRNEGRDGYDTIEWAARQPWSNGKVGTFGLSYPGAVQWLAAVESPPHLKAMVPAMTFASPNRFFYFNGVFDSSWIPWIWYNIAPDRRARAGLRGEKTYDEARASWKTERSRVLGSPLGAVREFRTAAPFYFDWLRHPAGDAWWTWANLAGKYGRTNAAVLNLSGWNDEGYGPDGATRNFAGLVASRRGGAARAALVIGPWVHGVEETGQTKVGDREFGPTARIDYDETILRWMDRYLRDVDNGVDREKPVRVFVMGENRWLEAETWPVPGTREVTLYFAPDGGLAKEAPTASESSSSFRSDPASPVADPYDGDYGARDFRALSSRKDLLTFETEPLESPVTVVGPMTIEVHVSSDAKDFDLWARVYDVAPDGTVWNLMSPGVDVLRASYRSGAGRRELLRPGRVYTLRFTNLATANTFAEGHRIRVQLSGAFAPHLSRNLQTGRLENDSTSARAATIVVRHDLAHPSRIVLPVLGTRGTSHNK